MFALPDTSPTLFAATQKRDTFRPPQRVWRHGSEMQGGVCRKSSTQFENYEGPFRMSRRKKRALPGSRPPPPPPRIPETVPSGLHKSSQHAHLAHILRTTHQQIRAAVSHRTSYFVQSYFLPPIFTHRLDEISKIPIRIRAKTPHKSLPYVLTSSFSFLLFLCHFLSSFTSLHFCTTSSLEPAESPPCFNQPSSSLFARMSLVGKPPAIAPTLSRHPANLRRRNHHG